MANSLNTDIEGRYVVIAEDRMGEQYADIKFRVFRAESGFGCRNFTIGTAVVGTTPYDNETFRIEGYEIERFATDEEIALVTTKTEEN